MSAPLIPFGASEATIARIAQALELVYPTLSSDSLLNLALDALAAIEEDGEHFANGPQSHLVQKRYEVCVAGTHYCELEWPLAPDSSAPATVSA